MKKIISLIAVCAATMPAYAVPHMVRRDSDSYNVTYDYRDKAKTGWYLTGHADLSLLNFTNKYSSDEPGVNASFNKDSYSFEPVFSGGLTFGRRFGYFVRGDLELGYIGNFKDKDEGFEYELSIPYLMANGYYDFFNGFYVGAGLGAAMPTMKIDGDIFVDSGNRTKRGFGVIGGINLGYAYQLDDNIVLDLRYRLAGITGVKHNRQFQVYDTVNDAYVLRDVTVKTGFIMDNSFSLGIRYEF